MDRFAARPSTPFAQALKATTPLAEEKPKAERGSTVRSTSLMTDTTLFDAFDQTSADSQDSNLDYFVPRKRKKKKK